MTYLPLKIPPGILRTGTNYQTAGRWYDGDLVRFYGKTIRPFGGWARVTLTTLEGPGRGIICWRPSDLRRLAGIGTVNKLYIWDDDTVSDITPVGFNPGVLDTFYGVGYGYGPYGDGPYGSISGSGAVDATTWSLDSYGDYLVACASHDRTIYLWEGVTTDPAEALENAPSAIAIVVTAERIIIALGADGDLRNLAWCDPDDPTVWTPDTTNFAGSQRIQSDGTLVVGVRVRGKTLILTTTSAHTMEFIGPPDVYRIDDISSNCGIVAPLAIQAFDGGAMWMGQKNFHMYSGGVVKPVECEVHDYIFKDINFDQAAKFTSGYIAAFGEVLFFYCSAGSTSIDRCVAYNHREGHWNILPSLRRGCWADVGAFLRPMAVSDAGVIYAQETGFTADGTPILDGRFLRSGPVEVGQGDRVIEVDQILTDEDPAGSIRLRFHQRFTPNGPTYPAGPYTVANYTDARLTARQVDVEFESVADQDFRVGVIRLDGNVGSRR